jgi:hypothetical protein
MVGGGIIVDFFIGLKKKYQTRKLIRAIGRADFLAHRSGRRFMVLKYGNRFLVKSKGELKLLIRQGYFRKGFDIQTAERIALHITK